MSKHKKSVDKAGQSGLTVQKKGAIAEAVQPAATNPVFCPVCREVHDCSLFNETFYRCDKTKKVFPKFM